MAFWDRGQRLIDAQAELANTRQAGPLVGISVLPTWDEFRDLSALYACQVPAFNRIFRLVSGTVAQLPLIQWRDNQALPQDANALLTQPEPDRVYWVSMQRTVADLFLHAVAFWLVLDTDANGYPRRVKVLPASECGINHDQDTVTWKGRDYAISHPAGPGTAIGRVLVFPGFGDGILITARDLIESALAIESAARNMAATPIPQVVLKNNGADLSRQEIDELLDGWEASRRSRSTAYMNSVIDADTMGWSSAELQLVEARNQVAVQIARACNADPYWAGAGVEGSSMVYSNRVDARRDLIDFTLSNYMAPIQERLSARDVTPGGNLVRYDTSEFLRHDPIARANMAVQLLGAQIIDVDEARAIINDSPTTTGRSL